VASVQFPHDELVGYDDRLNLRWRTPLPAMASWVIVDRSGRALAILQDDRFGRGTSAAIWVDHDGHPGAIFQAPAGFVSTQRVGSGFFIADSAATTFQWIGQIDSLATSSSPAPAWLQARPNTRLHMVQGGTGYGVMSEPGNSASCSQTIEIVAPSGTSCGTAAFSAGSGSCDMRDIVIGYDGTVVQKLPDAKEKQCAFGACSCTWQWWPGFFR
jgi:hypothetical protein